MSRRAGRELTHRDVPSAAALRPSSVVASFHVTKGRPCSTANVQARLTARASSASRPPSTSTPDSRRNVAPPIATGLVSACANTTRTTPASTRAREHGPVRPVWLHGSSVTTAVAPRARSPARVRASTSACGEPAPRWNPSATVSAGRVEQHAADPWVGAEGDARRAGQLEGAHHRGALGAAGGHRVPSRPCRRTPGRRERQACRLTGSPACASHPDFHRRSRSSTWSTGCWLQPGRGLSPPARNYTDPRARELFTRFSHQPATPRTPGVCEVRDPVCCRPRATRRRPRSPGATRSSRSGRRP